MLRQGTVIVLGAAVSHELGLPLGYQLKDRIIEGLPTDAWDPPRRVMSLIGAMHSVAGEAWVSLCERLRLALPLAASIDNLIEHQAHDEKFRDVAKLAIASVIAAAERQAKYEDARTYTNIFQLMMAGCGRDCLEEAFSRVSFITFNYDGTLENFMARAVAAYSDMKFDEARAFVKAHLKVHHVYGAVGEVPLHGDGRGGDAPDHLKRMAQGLRTFSEEVESVQGLALKDVVRGASQVIILGCAHHPRNFDLLNPGDAVFTRVYATQYVAVPVDPLSMAVPSLDSFAAPAITAFRSAVGSWASDRPAGLATISWMIEPLTCSQLVAKYGTSWLE